jgi:hypothetical protein
LHQARHRFARIHQCSPDIPALRLLTCWLPWPCDRLSGLRLLRNLRPARCHQPTTCLPFGRAGCTVVRATPDGSHVHPEVDRRVRRPALPLRHRHGYPADLHRGLLVGCHIVTRSSPLPAQRGRVRAAVSPYPPDLSWWAGSTIVLSRDRRDCFMLLFVICLRLVRSHASHSAAAVGSWCLATRESMFKEGSWLSTPKSRSQRVSRCRRDPFRPVGAATMWAIAVVGVRSPNPEVVVQQPDGLLLPEDLIWSPHLGMRRYWRDIDSLNRWRRSEPHRLDRRCGRRPNECVPRLAP